MRIIITNDGIKEIKASAEEKKAFVSNEIISCHSRSRSKLQSKSKANSIMNRGDSMSSSMNDMSGSIYKTIELKQRRLAIPPNKSLLYDYEKGPSGGIIKQMPEVLSSLSVNSPSLPKLKESYSLQELISPNCFINLEKKLKKGQKIALRNRKVDERVFRSDKTGNEIFKEINDCKKATISASHASMIEYLLGKTTITDCFVKNLSSFQKNRINRLNKISQRILVRKEREKVTIKEMQSKIALEKAEEKKKYKAEIESIEEDMKGIEKIVAVEHPTSKTDKRIFKFIHSEKAREYWKANKYDRYCFNFHSNRNRLCNKNESSRSIKYFKQAIPFMRKEENN